MYLLFVIITFIYLLINSKYKLKNDIRNNILIIISLIISFGSYASLIYIIFIDIVPKLIYSLKKRRYRTVITKFDKVGQMYNN